MMPTIEGNHLSLASTAFDFLLLFKFSKLCSNLNSIGLNFVLWFLLSKIYFQIIFRSEEIHFPVSWIVFNWNIFKQTPKTKIMKKKKSRIWFYLQLTESIYLFFLINFDLMWLCVSVCVWSDLVFQIQN